MPIEYEALHDRWLVDYFHTPRMHDRLVRRLGKVDRRDKVLCTLKQYNDYRLYLWRVLQMMVRNKEVMTLKP